MKVKELLADPARWTNSEEVKGARKKILCVIDPKIDPETEFPQWKKIINFNDTATHAEVMKVLEEADV
jgi:hypothetical protein